VWCCLARGKAIGRIFICRTICDIDTTPTCRGKRFFLFTKPCRPSRGLIHSPFRWLLVVISLEIKLCEADYPPPSRAEVKNERSCTPISPYAFVVCMLELFVTLQIGSITYLSVWRCLSVLGQNHQIHTLFQCGLTVGEGDRMSGQLRYHLPLSYVRQAVYSRTIEDLYSLHRLIMVTLETTTPDGPCRVWQEGECRLDVCRATNSTPFSTKVIYESLCCIWCLLIFLPYVMITKWQANENPRWLCGHTSLMCICIRSPQIRKGLPSGILLTYLVRNLIFHKHSASNEHSVPMETIIILFIT